MNFFSRWLKNARSVSLPQSVLPAILAAVLALGQGDFHPLLALLAVVGVALVHLAMNLADDYFDYKVDMLGDRDKVVRQGFRAMMVKYPYLTDGSETPRSLARVILGMLGLAALCGAVIFTVHSLENGIFTPYGSWRIVAVCVAAASLGIFYSAPPFKLGYRGLGETVIGTCFGPLIMAGVCYSACGRIVPAVLWLSLPVGLAVMNILYTHSFIEMESDRASNKKTLAGLIGTYRRNVVFAWILNLLPYAIVIAAVCLRSVHPAYLLLLLELPASIWLCRSLTAYAAGQTGVPEKAPWYLGPMHNMERSRELGVDWFRMRWLTARNILSAFCLLIMAVRLVLLAF